MSQLKHFLIMWLVVALSACATVDFDYPKAESTAVLNTDATHFGKLLATQRDAHPDMAGFYVLTDGIEALAARLLLAERAEQAIDAQYYLITDDMIGLVFIGALLEAADRGVRVRLLLDDIQTQGYDAGMAALDSHPNFEVRIFNPFGQRGSRAGSITDFSRVNRRMHNKSFTVDNQVTLIGGRNIAAEYFAARGDVNFSDVDVLSIGESVGDVSAMFDTYWNHRAAAPVPAFAKMPDDPAAALELLRGRIADAFETATASPYAAAIEDSFLELIEGSTDAFTWAPYQLVYDSPDKSDKKLATDAASITTPLAKAISAAQSEVIIVSPYFVPLKSGVAFLSELAARGVDVSVVTNSLAATNHSIVHSGYAPYRKPLLENGVKLYEVRPDSVVSGTERSGIELDRGGGGAAIATLHTKAFAVDRQHVFIGSFNWDPRSVDINTELGVIIESASLAGSSVDRVRQNLPTTAYEVVLNDKGKVRWIDNAGDQPVVLDKEPQTSFWRRFSAGFYRILPIKGQL
ncbi:MAG: phospholipase D family protein [Gammaproteobacteria bacterium]|nr:phospholipase D family protein [Gammaproteobacteria bacterium]